MNETTIIHKSLFFAASRETVWEFLTDKEKLGTWFYPAEANLAKDEDYVLLHKQEDGSLTKQCWGTVLEMEAPSKLVWTFSIAPLDGAMTTITWTLEEALGGTRLSLKHEGVEAAGMGLLMGLDSGWDKHFGNLRTAIA